MPLRPEAKQGVNPREPVLVVLTRSDFLCSIFDYGPVGDVAAGVERPMIKLHRNVIRF